MAALSRMARREHIITVGEGDTILLASSLIPGNENAVFRVINGLMRLGATVVHKGNAKVHVSGHASAGELVYCYNIVKPRNVMPVHGESTHLRANGVLAVRTGVPSDRVILAKDGVTVDLVGGVATISGKVPAGLVYVDGQTVGRATEDTLKERRLLREGGVITVLALVDPSNNTLAEPLEFLTRGFVHDDHTFDGASAEVEKALERASGDRVQDVERLEQLIGGAVSRYIQRTYRREPVVIAIVVDA